MIVPLLDKSYFPHLMREETEIFVRWLAKYEDLYLAFDFDVRVGEGAVPAADVVDKISAGYKRLTQKRIDVVGTQPELITIFEVRPHANQTALGNLLAQPHQKHSPGYQRNHGGHLEHSPRIQH